MMDPSYTRGALYSYAFCLTWLLGLATAADCGATAATTITDFDALGDLTRACTSYAGDILIQSMTFSPTDLPASPTLTLGGIATVAGSVQFSNIKVQGGLQRRQVQVIPNNPSGDSLPAVGIEIPDLVSVGGTLGFSDINEVALNMPSLPKLYQVHNLEWNAVNFSNDATLSNEKLLKLNTVQGIHFTSTNVRGIDLSAPEGPVAGNGTEVTLLNNDKLESVSIGRFDTKMAIDIDSNEYQPDVEFQYLADASLKLRGVKSFDAPSLESLSDMGTGSTLEIAYNTFKVLRLPNLKRILGSVSIEQNALLTTLDLPMLQEVHDLSILGNPRLKSVDIDSSRVTGDVTIDSTGSFKCESLKPKIPGLNCVAPSTVTSASSGSDGGDGSLSSGAKIGIGVGVGVGAAILLIGAVGCFCYRRRSKGSDETREISTAGYSKPQDNYKGGSDMSYAQVPYHTAPPAVVKQTSTEEPTPTSAESHQWTAPERNMQSTKGLMELEEQQGTRHEMDARSLQSMDSDEDDEAETRSLEDIERIHAQR